MSADDVAREVTAGAAAAPNPIPFSSQPHSPTPCPQVYGTGPPNYHNLQSPALSSSAPRPTKSAFTLTTSKALRRRARPVLLSSSACSRSKSAAARVYVPLYLPLTCVCVLQLCCGNCAGALKRYIQPSAAVQARTPFPLMRPNPFCSTLLPAPYDVCRGEGFRIDPFACIKAILVNAPAPDAVSFLRFELNDVWCIWRAPLHTTAASRITHHASRITHHATRITHHRPFTFVTSPSQRALLSNGRLRAVGRARDQRGFKAHAQQNELRKGWQVRACVSCVRACRVCARE